MDISFIISAHNNQGTVAKCIWSIMKAMRDQRCAFPVNYQPAVGVSRASCTPATTIRKSTYEILVIDNASTDKTVEAIQHYDVTIMELEKRENPGKVCNLGVAATSGTIIVFLDANIILNDSWKENLSDTCQAVMSCPSLSMIKLKPPTKSTWVINNWFGDRDGGMHDYLDNGQMIITRAVYTQLLGYDETLPSGEQCDFWNRAKKRDCINYATALTATQYDYPGTVDEFFQYEREQGLGDYVNLDMLKTRRTTSFLLIYFILLMGVVITAYNGDGWSEKVLIMSTWIVSTIAMFSGMILSFKIWSKASPKKLRIKNMMQEWFLTGVYLTARLTAGFDAIWYTIRNKYRERKEQPIQIETE